MVATRGRIRRYERPYVYFNRPMQHPNMLCMNRSNALCSCPSALIPVREFALFPGAGDSHRSALPPAGFRAFPAPSPASLAKMSNTPTPVLVFPAVGIPSVSMNSSGPLDRDELSI